MPVGSCTWTLVKHHALHWRSWDEDELLVYHRGTGDTHLLNQFGADVIAALDARTMTVPQIVEWLADLYEVDSRETQLSAQVEEVLREFDELGLIEPVT